MLAAEIIVRVVKRRELPMHLVRGAGAVGSALGYSRIQLAELGAWETVSASAGFEAPYPVDPPPDVTPD